MLEKIIQNFINEIYNEKEELLTKQRLFAKQRLFTRRDFLQI
jgi:hypothetical protein